MQCSVVHQMKYNARSKSKRKIASLEFFKCISFRPKTIALPFFVEFFSFILFQSKNRSIEIFFELSFYVFSCETFDMVNSDSDLNVIALLLKKLSPNVPSLSSSNCF